MTAVFTIFASLAAIAFLPVVTAFLRLVRQRSLWSVPGPKSVSFVSGKCRSLSRYLGPDAIQYQAKLRDEYGRIIRIPGYFGEQILSIADTKALYDIFIKNQDSFEQAEYFRENVRLLFGGPGLFSTLGDAHRKQRKLMNPAFSINHMRRMVPIFRTVTLQLQNIMRANIGNEPTEVDIMEYMGRLALDLITHAGFGHSFHAVEGKDDNYSLAVKKLLPLNARLMLWRPLLPYLTRNIPGYVLRFIADRMPWPALHELIENADIALTTSRRLWEEKKRLHAIGDKSVINEYGEGKDILSIMFRANVGASEEERLSEEELMAQITTFTVAGSDTTSNALSRIFHFLSLHPEVQDKLREELTEACGASGEITYDDLMDLPYLEAVCRETLRLHPPVHLVQRHAREDFVLPLAHSFTDTDDKDKNELFVPRGTTIFANIIGVNQDQGIWGPDAMAWRPERWLSPLPETVAQARVPGVYSNLLTFIGGGRACIGFKFSQLEMKVALAQLIPTFRFTPSEKHEIVWRFGGVVTPSYKGSKSSEPELPMCVSLVS
ncbi:cytochrome P450 [Vararia minispora EC-137]|uniref:Cytochrome P450 n=1 Tax=Vararia minispora EC-137 TaxID=1314806 RepID=A0ACB8QGG6_9AGAM|nr:cytochrome P450 [Vararia minispora EC-137]